MAAVAPARAEGPVQPIRPGPQDWPTYGHDAQHTFHGVTTLTATELPLLARAWFFPTNDAVTANPVVVADTVYVGSWDGNFYAVNRATGALRWKYTIKPQPAVSPVPGETFRNPTSDGGLITSSAWFQPAGQGLPNTVIFGGGYTLYALNAATGALLWSHEYTGLPEQPPNPTQDEARIFSSPTVVRDRVLFAVSSDGQNGHRGYVAAADLRTGAPVWRFETDVVPGTTTPRNDGCGGVWSSPTVLAKLDLVVYDVADCDFKNPPPYEESVFALRIGDGKLAWLFRPDRVDADCDWDFGATANEGVDGAGNATFLGVGGKDGTYYSLDPATGRLRWQTNVVFGGLAGGFIGTPAYDGTTIFGASALGDFGRFEGFGSLGCDPTDPRDGLVQEPSLHAFDASTGKVLWQQPLSQSFGPTTTAGGFVFIGTGITRQIKIHDAATGRIAGFVPMDASSDSGVIPAGNALFVGTGSSEQGVLAGLTAYTPLGVSPTWVAAPAVGASSSSAPPAPVGFARRDVLANTGGPGLPAGAVLVLVVALVSSRLGRRAGRRCSP
jgi:polyvinyl alcohol dehydrogenase (cytochrome)